MRPHSFAIAECVAPMSGMALESSREERSIHGTTTTTALIWSGWEEVPRSVAFFAVQAVLVDQRMFRPWTARQVTYYHQRPVAALGRYSFVLEEQSRKIIWEWKAGSWSKGRKRQKNECD